MKKVAKLFALVMLITLGSCASVKVVTDRDNETDFSKYETYSFLGWQDDSNKLLNEFDQKRLRDAFKAEMDARGLEFVQEGGDMEISLFIVLDQKTSMSSYTNYYDSHAHGYRRYGGWGMGHSTTTYQESDYTVGTLVMDVFDSESQNQVFQIIASSTVNDNPEKRDKTIPKAVNRLMAEFPVEPMS